MLEEHITNDMLRAAIVFAAFTLFALIFRSLWQRIVTKLAVFFSGKSLDGTIVRKIGGPISFVIILVGAYLGFKELEMWKHHAELAYDIFYVLFLIFSAFVLSRVLKGIVDKWLEVKRHYTRIPELINKFIVIVVFVLVAFMIMIHFEVEITPLLATLGVGGLAAGLALQKTLGDFFAGVHIISDKPINVGHYIEIDKNTSGYVEDIGWRSTRIRTLPNNIVVVPNSKLAESTIINHSLPIPEMSILIECGVSYGSDLQKVEKVTVEEAKKIQKSIEGGVEDFEPFIRYHTYGDSNIQFTVIMRVKKFVDQYLVKHEFIKALKKRYDKEKIEISWPVTKVYLSKTKVK